MRPAVSSRSLPAVQSTRHHQDQLSHSDAGSTMQIRDSIPYRLPRIPQSNHLPHSAPTREAAHKPASQERLYQIDYIGSDRLEKYLRRRKKLPAPPHTIAQLRRQEGIHMPTFQRANIEPALPHNKVDECEEDPALGQSTSRTSLSTRNSSLALSGLGKQGTDRPQEDTPGADKHAAWRLSPHQHKNYDVQAIRGQNGPFSRDFIVHCNTPNSWLRMKLKRQKTAP